MKKFADIADELARKYKQRWIEVERKHRKMLAEMQDLKASVARGYTSFGAFHEAWEKKQELAQNLLERGGRKKYPYCMTCSRIRNTKPQYEVVPA